jgi:SM-20-related protein
MSSTLFSQNNQNNFNKTGGVLESLAQDQILVMDGFFPRSQWQRWAQTARDRKNQGLFRESKIGRGLQNQRSEKVRGDSTLWIDPADGAVADFFAWTQEFQRRAQQEFFLPLRSSEIHFAHYPVGSHYDAHYDQSPQRDLVRGQRIVTFILYLNDHWKNEDGGELVVYPPVLDDQTLTEEVVDKEVQNPIHILPIGGRLVMFMSDLLLHEVRICHAERMSLTGWFRDDLENT